jgi:hypothetical protein
MRLGSTIGPTLLRIADFNGRYRAFFYTRIGLYDLNTLTGSQAQDWTLEKARDTSGGSAENRTSQSKNLK